MKRPTSVSRIRATHARRARRSISETPVFFNNASRSAPLLMFRGFFFRLVAPVFFRSSPARRSPAAPFSRGGDLLLEHVHDRLLPAVHRRAHRRDLRLRVAEHLPPRRGGVPAALGDDGLVARLSRRAIRRDLGVRLRLGLAQARGFLCGISRRGSGGGRGGSGRGGGGEARRGGGRGSEGRDARGIETPGGSRRVRASPARSRFAHPLSRR